MAVNCSDPKALLASAACFCAYRQKEHLMVQTYLLATLVGGSTDPKTLLFNAKEWRGVSEKDLQVVIAYLLCANLNA